MTLKSLTRYPHANLKKKQKYSPIFTSSMSLSVLLLEFNSIKKYYVTHVRF
jgi:hypothetical protein